MLFEKFFSAHNNHPKSDQSCWKFKEIRNLISKFSRENIKSWVRHPMVIKKTFRTNHFRRGHLPREGPLQGGGDSLSGNEIFWYFHVCGQREPLVDLLLVGKLPPTRLLTELDKGRVVWDGARDRAGEVLGARRHVGVLWSSGSLLWFSIWADPWMFVNYTWNVNRASAMRGEREWCSPKLFSVVIQIQSQSQMELLEAFEINLSWRTNYIVHYF